MTRTIATVVVAALLLIVTGAAEAKKPPYPTFTCASAKQQAAANYCASVLKAWAKFDTKGDAAKRDDAVAKAFGKLEKAWDRAEDKAATKDAFDCSQSSFVASAADAFIGSAVGALVDAVNDGLPVGTKDAKCGAQLLKSAAGACAGIVKAQAKATKQVAKPKARSQRDKKIEKALTKAGKGYDKATRKTCPTTATRDGFVAGVDDLAQRTIVAASVSSAVPGDDFLTIAPTAPVEYDGRTLTAQCIDGGPYAYFVRRGTENKVLYYFQGGGACWEQLTCSIATCDTSVTPGDNPANAMSGFADMDNPANPFRNWNVVFVSYCSCDIHFGDAAQDYDNFNPETPLHIEHRGYQNSRIVEKFAREHFVNPDTVFVTGSSAGAYGAWFNAPLLHEAWPGSRFHILADAGNGVITPEFRAEFFPNWDFEKNTPDIPELQGLFDGVSGIPEYTEVVADLYPDTTWSHYTAAFDGGSGGQTGFYNLMLNDNDPVAALTWWGGSCAFTNTMRDQAVATHQTVSTSGPDNYRYYISTGSRHTMWGANKVYTDTTGGVPTLVDWVNAQLASGGGVKDPPLARSRRPRSPPIRVHRGHADADETDHAARHPGRGCHPCRLRHARRDRWYRNVDRDHRHRHEIQPEAR
jgi:hypothetical protein